MTAQQPAIAPQTRASDDARLARELARARTAAARIDPPDAARPALAVQGVPAPPPAPAAPQAPGVDVRTTQLPGGAQIRTDGNGTTITGPDGETHIGRDAAGRTIITTPGGDPIVIGPNGILRGTRPITSTESFPPPNNDIPREVVPLVGTIFGTVAATIVLFPIARAWARRMDRKAVPPSPEVTGRLDRIEQAIETIAIEVERVSEAQRYSAKLLTERLPENVARVGAAGAVGAEARR